MRFLTAFIATTAAFAAPALANPLPEDVTPSKIEARAPVCPKPTPYKTLAAGPLSPRLTPSAWHQQFVTCSATLVGGNTPRQYTVDVARAQAQALIAGMSTGKSGDPHRYFNTDGLAFGKNNCDRARALLMEYPIYWRGVAGDWQKDVLTARQPNGATPIRAVYANVNGAVIFCGVMTHSEVTPQNQGTARFRLCT
ncbi:hypothetical protein RB595_009024 [Gaeumannomyces hyphopodioides]